MFIVRLTAKKYGGDVSVYSWVENEGHATRLLYEEYPKDEYTHQQFKRLYFN